MQARDSGYMHFSNKRSLFEKSAAALYSLGLLSGCQKYLLRKRCVVITYHRITRPSDEAVPLQDGMYVLPEVFEEHLRYFRRRFNVIGLDEFVETMKSGRSFDRACLLTFDDGWVDNYRNAFPLLRKYGVPATVFLATDYIGSGRWFWPDQIAYLLAKSVAATAGSTMSGPARDLMAVYRQGRAGAEERLNAAIEYMKGQSAETIQAVIGDLCRLSGTACLPQDRQAVSWDEVREMQQSGIAFGSHTKSHAILTALESEQAVLEELTGSKAIIEQETGQCVRAFCFPNGNYNVPLMKAVEGAGYDCAFLCVRGTVTVGMNPFALPRVSLHNDISSSRSLLAYRILSGSMRGIHA